MYVLFISRNNLCYTRNSKTIGKVIRAMSSSVVIIVTIGKVFVGKIFSKQLRR